MKRVFVFSMVVTILLASCVSVPSTNPALNTSPTTSETYAYDPDAKPTKATAPATKPSTTPTTEPTETEPPETEPIPTLSGEPLSQEQLNEYQNNLDTNSTWNCATTTVFSDPSQINLGLLFYNGAGRDLNKLTDEEFAHFSAQMNSLEYIDVHVLPPDRMSQILTEYFGITFDETEKRGMDQFAYWEETGNYYWFGTDCNSNMDIEILAGSTLSDDSVQILYRSTQTGHDAEVKNESNLWIMTFTPEGKIFSNLPA